MSDEALRELERAVAASPTDVVLKQRLERAWQRVGLGWHGEVLPRGLRFCEERGVYEWERTRSQFVYVPASEGLCALSFCEADGYWRHSGDPNTRRRKCPDCNGTKIVKVAPFYIGRFPVTNVEWAAFFLNAIDSLASTESTRWAPAPETYLHPVVSVNLTDAQSFTEWAGLRLPSATEWRLAALGPLDGYGPHKRFCKKCYGSKRTSSPTGGFSFEVVTCHECHGTGVAQSRRFPWGDANPTLPDQVVASDPRYACQRTAPVVVKEYQSVDGRWQPGEGPITRLVPARPAGVSWCGAHDMVGHVWNLSRDGDRFGGSFRSRWWPTDGVSGIGNQNLGLDRSVEEATVGFRMALSAV